MVASHIRRTTGRPPRDSIAMSDQAIVLTACDRVQGYAPFRTIRDGCDLPDFDEGLSADRS